MSPLPANCPSCGHHFFSQSFVHVSGGGDMQLDLADNHVTCPKCGSWAKIADGKFLVTEDVTKLLSGPKATHDVLNRLQEIAIQLQKQEITPEQAVAEASDIDTGFGDLFAKIWLYGAPAVAILVAIIALNVQISSASLSTEEHKERQTELVKQTALLEQLVKQDAVQDSARQVKPRKAKPTKPKPTVKRAVSKKKSKRRADVRKARRQQLKARRIESGRRVTKPTFRPDCD